MYKRHVPDTPEKADQFRERVEALRVAHGLKKQDLYEAMGMSRQNYHYNFHKAKSFSERTVRGICVMFGITPYLLLQSSDSLFYRLEIFRALEQYQNAQKRYEEVKLGPWYGGDIPGLIKLREVDDDE